VAPSRLRQHCDNVLYCIHDIPKPRRNNRAPADVEAGWPAAQMPAKGRER
jgi:hypothetical protein